MLPRSAIHRTLWLQTRPLFPPNFRPSRAFRPSRSSAVRPTFRLISTETSETERTDNGVGGGDRGVVSTWSSSESPSSADTNIVTKEEIRQQTPESRPNQSGSLQPEPLRVHQFDTYKIVLALQNAGFSQPQAVALMKCLRTVLVNGTEFAKSHYLTRGDLENVPTHSLALIMKIGDVPLPRCNVGITYGSEDIKTQRGGRRKGGYHHRSEGTRCS